MTDIADPAASAAAAHDRRGFWARLSASGFYSALSGSLFATERRRFLLLAAIPLLWVFATHLGPVLQMARIGFLEAYPLSVGEAPVLTIQNFVLFFEERIYRMPFLRTFAFAIFVTAATLVIMFPVAYFLAKKLPKNRQLTFLLILLIPFWVGEIVRTFAIMILLGNRGAVNIALQSLGLIERPIPFMYTNFSLGMGVVYLTSLYMLLPLYAALEKIPQSMHEAARDLGAGPWTRFRRVTFPLSRDGVAAGCTLVFLISTGYYATPVLLGGPGTTVFAETVTGFFQVAGNEWPTGAAFATIMLVATLVTAGLFLKLMGRKGGGILS